VDKLGYRVLRLWTLGICLLETLAVQAQQPIIQSSDFFVETTDNVSIHVHRKVRAVSNKVPVLLIHGTWCDGRIWDFPGRSVMDYLAVRGYDVYALDLRGMGSSDHPPNYFTIDIVSRVQDAVAVADYIVANTGRAPVVMGWSQGGVVTGLLAASAPQLVAGLGFLSVPADGFFVPPQIAPVLQNVIASGVDRFVPTSDLIYALAFAIDPTTGKPTISADAFNIFLSLTEVDSVAAILEEVSPEFFNATLVPAWPAMNVPALVVDGALDPTVGQDRAQALFDELGSTNKQLTIFRRNSHTWFLEDDYNSTVRVFDQFLSQF
jgi:pimeloyl-ACP methyl ester carboxylesterase